MPNRRWWTPISFPSRSNTKWYGIGSQSLAYTNNVALRLSYPLWNNYQREDALNRARVQEEIAEATVPPEPGLENVESIQDLLAKQETAEGAEEAAEEDEVVTPASTRDERLEPLDARVVPMQETEFMCKNCYLVKHRSQLADKRKMLCRDCA